MLDSVRGRALDTIKRHSPYPHPGPARYCRVCDFEHPCPDYVAGTANLNDLNNADKAWRLGPAANVHYAPGNNNPNHGEYLRLIPDPDPLGGDHES